MPDYPETAKFLTEEERTFASERMGPYAPRGTDKHFDKNEFWATLKAWDFWAFALGYFFMTNSLNAFGFFACVFGTRKGHGGDIEKLTKTGLRLFPPSDSSVVSLFARLRGGADPRGLGLRCGTAGVAGSGLMHAGGGRKGGREAG